MTLNKTTGIDWAKEVNSRTPMCHIELSNNQLHLICEWAAQIAISRSAKSGPKGSFGYCAICYHPLDTCSHCDSPAPTPQGGEDWRGDAIEDFIATEVEPFALTGETIRNNPQRLGPFMWLSDVDFIVKDAVRRALATKPDKREWISVEDRLPGADEPIWMLVLGKRVAGARLYGGRAFRDTRGRSKTPTHWCKRFVDTPPPFPSPDNTEGV